MTYLIYGTYEEAEECNRIMTISSHSAFAWSEILKINRDGIQYAIVYNEDYVAGIPSYIAIESWNDSWTLGIEEF